MYTCVPHGVLQVLGGFNEDQKPLDREEQAQIKSDELTAESTTDGIYNFFIALTKVMIYPYGPTSDLRHWLQSFSGRVTPSEKIGLCITLEHPHYLIYTLEHPHYLPYTSETSSLSTIRV